MEYAAIEQGEPVGPSEFHITPDVAREYHESIDVSHPRFTSTDSRLVEPSITGRFSFNMLIDAYGQGRVHAQQTFDFMNPIYVDDTLTAEGHISDKYVKRGRKFVEATIDFTNDDDTLVARSIPIIVAEKVED